MTPLREKMIQDMQLYRLASTTQDSYLRSVEGLAKYYKNRKMLAHDWKYDPEKARLLVKS